MRNHPFIVAIIAAKPLTSQSEPSAVVVADLRASFLALQIDFYENRQVPLVVGSPERRPELVHTS